VLVGGAILPHPPIILPRFADRRGEEVEATIAAVRAACRWVADVLRPDRIVISSPHEGHGFTVPLFFLEEAMGTAPVTDELLTDDPSYAAYRTLGAELRRREAAGLDRVAVIASGDCSHRLRPDGPYGAHPLAADLDRAIVAAVRAGSCEALLDIDPVVVEAGGECGLRGFVWALAALLPPRCDILSYEAPYGVGYMVAVMEPGMELPDALPRPRPPVEQPPKPGHRARGRLR
jgi:aromatic ring-opening dioxygenase LigB subunit